MQKGTSWSGAAALMPNDARHTWPRLWRRPVQLPRHWLVNHQDDLQRPPTTGLNRECLCMYSGLVYRRVLQCLVFELDAESSRRGCHYHGGRQRIELPYFLPRTATRSVGKAVTTWRTMPVTYSLVVPQVYVSSVVRGDTDADVIDVTFARMVDVRTGTLLKDPCVNKEVVC